MEHELFFQAISNIPGDIPISYPNPEKPYSGDKPYYKVSILPAGAVALGISETNYNNGICQILCFVRDGDGEIAALNMAEAIKNIFPRGTKLSDGTMTIHIDQPARIAPGINSDGWYAIPVSIPYYFFT